MKDQEGIRANRPADIEPAKVSKNLITTMKKCSPDEDWRWNTIIKLKVPEIPRGIPSEKLP
jgi:hypothetical protein